jgi:hypothetical protein
MVEPRFVPRSAILEEARSTYYPGPMTDAEVLRLSSADKLAEAMRRSMPHLPAEARRIVEGLLQPGTLAIVTGTLLVWGASHVFGVGEIVDLVLLGVGVVGIGFAVFDGAGALYEFVETAINARMDSQLETAGKHFARAVTLLGISTVQGLLLRGQGGKVLARGQPRIYPRVKVGPAPAAGNQLRLTRPTQIAGGAAGKTDAYGVISVARNQSLDEQRITLFHELVHRFFSPRTGPLRQLRAEVNWSAYSRSALLRYLEEALAETYAQLRVNGLAMALEAIRFPIKAGYVTVSAMATEGQAIGTITLGGALLHVSISQGPLPDVP